MAAPRLGPYNAETAMQDTSTGAPIAPSASLYVVKAGTAYVVWDPAKSAGEYATYVTLDFKYKVLWAGIGYSGIPNDAARQIACVQRPRRPSGDKRVAAEVLSGESESALSGAAGADLSGMGGSAAATADPYPCADSRVTDTAVRVVRSPTALRNIPRTTTRPMATTAIISPYSTSAEPDSQDHKRRTICRITPTRVASHSESLEVTRV